MKYIRAGNAAVKQLSLSVRRAWIEMTRIHMLWIIIKSLSVRRAWIEMYCVELSAQTIPVALREESVD